MPYLPFIADDKLCAIVKSVVDAGANAEKKADLGRNVIDPFAVLFEMAAFGLTEANWEKNERTRQAQKTLVNQLGNLHQSILGAVAGWEDLGVGSNAGCDLVNHDRHIVAEVKNKHNTVSGGKLIDLYNDLQSQVMPKNSRYHGYSAYYVQIIPKQAQPYDLPFTPPDRSTGAQAASNPRIRVIDGASFYALVTGHQDALQQLHRALPKILADCYPATAQTLKSTAAQQSIKKAYGL